MAGSGNTISIEHETTGTVNVETNLSETIILQQLEKLEERKKEIEENINNEKLVCVRNDALSKKLINQTNEMTIHETKQLSNMTMNMNDIRLEKSDIQITNKLNNCSINGHDVDLATNILKTIFNGNTEFSGYTFGDVNIDSSSQIHLGNITYVTGPININYNVNKVEYTTDIKQELHVFRPFETPKTIPMVYRDLWLAKPASEEIFRIDTAAKLIIICHTVSSSCINQAGNVSCVRLIQTYHIESKGWSDIGYNFLIDCDGQVYEGRVWRKVGNHSKGFNSNSLGIAFIGTFDNKIPTKEAIDVFHRLIEFGVQQEMIDTDYQLIGQCQCRPFQSPGNALYQAIKTWAHWTPNFNANRFIKNSDNQDNEIPITEENRNADNVYGTGRR